MPHGKSEEGGRLGVRAGEEEGACTPHSPEHLGPLAPPLGHLPGEQPAHLYQHQGQVAETHPPSFSSFSQDSAFAQVAI